MKKSCSADASPMPEGWKRMNWCLMQRGIPLIYEDHHFLLDIVKEMAEVLEDMENNPYDPIGHDGLAVLKKFKDWK